MSNAEVIFWIGPQLEAFLQPALNAVSARVTIISLQDAEADPHVWMDPIAAVQIGRRMAAAFATLRPERRAAFEANADRLGHCARAAGCGTPCAAQTAAAIARLHGES